MLMIYFFSLQVLCVWHLWTATDWENPPPLFSPWLLSGTVSSELRYFWHIAGATVGFLDDQHFRQTLLDILLTVWSDKRERQKENKKNVKKDVMVRRFLSDIFADTLRTFWQQDKPVPGCPLWSTESSHDIDVIVCKKFNILCRSCSVLTTWIFRHWSNSGDRCAKWGVTLPTIQKWRGLTFHPRQSL